MKLVRCILSIVLLLFILVGCTKTQQNGNVVNFYYCAAEPSYGAETGLFAIEERHITYSPSEYRKLIEEYLNGAKKTGCTSPFPGGTTLVDFILQEGNASIILSPHMALQSQADVITCCACLCQTLFALPDIDTVTISIDGTQINGENRLQFQRDSLKVFDDVSSGVTPQP
ncbi:MAG: GerMN domain-containing protein [Oscillospiraceae bacterium]|nr:GerMN domain-containing protein [Oscillospiraceae bacterium]